MRRRAVCSLMILALALSTAVGCGGSPGENGSSGQQESVDGSGGEASGAGDEENGGEASGAGDEENGGEATGAEDDESGGEASGAEDEESGGQTSADGEEEVPILKDTVTDVMGCRIGAAATEMELKDPKVWEIITTHFTSTIPSSASPSSRATSVADGNIETIAPSRRVRPCCSRALPLKTGVIVPSKIPLCRPWISSIIVNCSPEKYFSIRSSSTSATASEIAPTKPSRR